MKFAAVSTLLVAASAVRTDRNLGETTTAEKDAWDAYLNAIKAQ